MHNQNQGLPFSYQQVDQSTFNGNLPNGNDKIPQLQLSPLMQQNQQIVAFAIGTFRMYLQSASNKSPLHCFTYNMLSSQWFQNQLYRDWCQRVIDFTEFLIRAQNNPPQVAVDKAAKLIYQGLLFMVLSNYQQLAQLPEVQNLINNLQQAGQAFQSIQNDVGAFKASQQQAGQFGGGVAQPGFMGQQGFNIAQPQGFNMGGQLPPVQSSIGGFTTGQQAFQAAPMMGVSPQPAPTTTMPGMAFDSGPAQQAPLTPVQEWTSGPVNQPVSQPQGNIQMNPVQQPEVSDLPIPRNVDDVKVDPFYYIPQGHKVDPTRPYDLIHNPGGIEIRPAHLTKWTRTPSDISPYSPMVSQADACLFYVRFPDGIVQEKFINWLPMMDYLKHEIQDELRRRAHRVEGVVYEVDTVISTIGGTPVTTKEVETLVADGKLESSSELAPVVLDTVFTLGSDLEVESEVRYELRQLLNVDEKAVLPAHEYKSMRLHVMELSDEAFTTLIDLSETGNLVSVATGLRDLVTTGKLSGRYYRFLNERLTKEINAFMRDSLSTTISIDDFVVEVGDLLDYVSTKKGADMLAAIRTSAAAIIGRAMTTYEGHDGIPDVIVRGVIDQYVNFQTGWMLDDIASLNIYTERAVLVSNGTHPQIREVLMGMIKRAGEEGMKNSTLRLITLDGVYLEVISGRLIKNAVLLRRLG